MFLVSCNVYTAHDVKRHMLAYLSICKFLVLIGYEWTSLKTPTVAASLQSHAELLQQVSAVLLGWSI
jgi:hypothetical protein